MGDPIIAASALKHGLSEEEILHAYRTPIRVWDLGEGLTMMIGANAAAIFLEVVRPGRGRGSGDRSRDVGAREVPEVMRMPRSVEEILQHADELAARFEQYEPDPSDELDRDAVAAVRSAVAERSAAEVHMLEAIRQARQAHLSWSAIGALVGTTGEAARQRYGNKVA